MEHTEKTLTAFSMKFKDEDGNELLVVYFKRIYPVGTKPEEYKVWNVTAARWKLNGVGDNEVYSFEYEFPKADMPVTLIAATCLKLLHMQMTSEMDARQSILFDISNKIEGM